MDYGPAVFDPTSKDVIWVSQRLPGRTFKFRHRKKYKNSDVYLYTCRDCGSEKNKPSPVPSIKIRIVNGEKRIFCDRNPDEGHFCPDKQQQQTRDTAKREATKKRKESDKQISKGNFTKTKVLLHVLHDRTSSFGHALRTREPASGWANRSEEGSTSEFGLVSCNEFEIVWKSRQFPGHTFYFVRKKKNEAKNVNYYTCKACGKEKAKKKRLDPVPSLTLSNDNYIIGNPEAGHFCIDVEGLPVGVSNVWRLSDKQRRELQHLQEQLHHVVQFKAAADASFAALEWPRKLEGPRFPSLMSFMNLYAESYTDVLRSYDDMEIDKAYDPHGITRTDYSFVSTTLVTKREAAIIGIILTRVPVWKFLETVWTCVDADGTGVFRHFYNVLCCALGLLLSWIFGGLEWATLEKARPFEAPYFASIIDLNDDNKNLAKLVDQLNLRPHEGCDITVIQHVLSFNTAANVNSHFYVELSKVSELFNAVIKSRAHSLPRQVVQTCKLSVEGGRWESDWPSDGSSLKTYLPRPGIARPRTTIPRNDPALRLRAFQKLVVGEAFWRSLAYGTNRELSLRYGWTEEMHYALKDFLPSARIERIRFSDFDFCNVQSRQGDLETAVGIFKRCLLLVDYVESIELLCSSYDAFNTFVHTGRELPPTLATVRAIVHVNPQKEPTDGHALSNILMSAVDTLASTGQPRALSIRGGHVANAERMVNVLYTAFVNNPQPFHLHVSLFDCFMDIDEIVRIVNENNFVSSMCEQPNQEVFCKSRYDGHLFCIGFDSLKLRLCITICKATTLRQQRKDVEEFGICLLECVQPPGDLLQQLFESVGNSGLDDGTFEHFARYTFAAELAQGLGLEGLVFSAIYARHVVKKRNPLRSVVLESQARINLSAEESLSSAARDRYKALAVSFDRTPVESSTVRYVDIAYFATLDMFISWWEGEKSNWILLGGPPPTTTRIEIWRCKNYVRDDTHCTCTLRLFFDLESFSVTVDVDDRGHSHGCQSICQAVEVLPEKKKEAVMMLHPKEFTSWWEKEKEHFIYTSRDTVGNNVVEIWRCRYALLDGYNCRCTMRMTRDLNTTFAYAEQSEPGHDHRRGNSVSSSNREINVPSRMEQGHLAQPIGDKRAIKSIQTSNRSPSANTSKRQDEHKTTELWQTAPGTYEDIVVTADVYKQIYCTYEPPDIEWVFSKRRALGIPIIDDVAIIAPRFVPYAQFEIHSTTPDRAVPIAPDGHCGYRTLACLLLFEEAKHPLLRQLLSDYVISHADELWATRLFGDTQGIREMAAVRMTAIGEEQPPRDAWMTTIDIVAAAVVFDVNIMCFDGTKWIVYNRNVIETGRMAVEQMQLCPTVLMSNINEHFEPVLSIK